MLSDGNLQLKVMKQEPPNFAASLRHTTNVEAYEQSLACQSTSVAEHDDGHAKCMFHDVL